MSCLYQILAGVITTIICGLLKKGFERLKSDAEKDSNDTESRYSPEQFRAMYYISLITIIVLFFVAINVTHGIIFDITVIPMLIVALFFNWCAAENLFEKTVKLRSDSTENDSENID
nr:MAG TPA: hypothetical protein [Caudoviricetes sp.]